MSASHLTRLSVSTEIHVSMFQAQHRLQEKSAENITANSQTNTVTEEDETSKQQAEKKSNLRSKENLGREERGFGGASTGGSRGSGCGLVGVSGWCTVEKGSAAGGRAEATGTPCEAYTTLCLVLQSGLGFAGTTRVEEANGRRKADRPARMEAGGVEAVVPSYGGRELAAADLQFSVTAGTEKEHVSRHRQPRPTGHSARTVQ